MAPSNAPRPFGELSISRKRSEIPRSFGTPRDKSRSRRLRQLSVQISHCVSSSAGRSGCRSGLCSQDLRPRASLIKFQNIHINGRKPADMFLGPTCGRSVECSLVHKLLPHCRSRRRVREREVINIVDTHELGNITRSQRFSGGNANADCGPARW